MDDILLVFKPSDVQRIHDLFNDFDENLKFTVDTCQDSTPHFLELELSSDGLTIYRKDTNTGLYTNFDSFVPWQFRKAWINSLVNRALKICAPNKLSAEMCSIKRFAS